MKDKPRFHGLMFHHFHNNYHPKGQGSISSKTFENILSEGINDKLMLDLREKYYNP